MSVTPGSAFLIMSAEDVSKNPEEVKAASAKDFGSNGRIIEVDEEEQEQDAWKAEHKKAQRCLKLGLKCLLTQRMVVGIEQEPIQYHGEVSSLTGQKVSSPYGLSMIINSL